MAHESTFTITFGGETLVAAGDLVEAEVGLSRTPQAPQASAPIRGVNMRFYHGRNLSHTLGWTIRREFATVAQARSYQWRRPAQLPQGRQTLVVVDSGITTTLADAHLTQFGLRHAKPCVILETVSVLGGAYSTVGSTQEPAWPGDPSDPLTNPVPGLDWILDTGTWRDGARWRDTALWSDN